MSKISAWLGAMRLRTLPLAASVVITGSASIGDEHPFSWGIFVLTLITTFLLQVLSNLANDYGDYSNGADNAGRVGPTRAVQSGEISPKQMKNAITLTASLCLVFGVSLLWLSLAESGYFMEALLFLSLGIASIAAAIKYTAGKNPYGYKGLGDVFVFVFFGLVGVIGTAFLQSKDLNMLSVLNAFVIGALSTAVLNLNNLRDHINDQAAGKITLVVKMGFQKGKYYQLFLLISALIAAIGAACILNSYWGLLAFVLPSIRVTKIMKETVPQNLDQELKKFAISALIYSLIQLVVFLV